MYDWLIVGAGFAGSVLAERFASVRNERVLLIDRRSHVGGNAYDRYNDDGIIVHQYGPHIFHTNSKQIFDYLSLFTEWRPYAHKVLAEVDGMLVPILSTLIRSISSMGLTSTPSNWRNGSKLARRRWTLCARRKMWWYRLSVENSTRSFSRGTRASSGASTLENLTSRLTIGCQSAPIVTIYTLGMNINVCLFTAITAYLKICCAVTIFI